MEKNPGAILIQGEPYIVPDSAHKFVLILIDYCQLCSSLPATSVELGLKTAEMMKFFNSRICQLIIGAGAISVSGLKTITIRNLALAQRSVQLVIRLIPFVKSHFENCLKKTETQAESKQLETFRKQFEQVFYIHIFFLKKKFFVVDMYVCFQRSKHKCQVLKGSLLKSVKFRN